MSWYPRIRDIHLWVGLALLLPLAVIAGTGVMLNHEHALGLKPQYKIPGDKPAKKSGSATLLTARPGAWSDHATDIRAALGAASDTWGEVPIEHVQLKDEPGFGLVVKVKAGKEQTVEPEEIVWSVAHQSVVSREEDKKAGMHWGKIVHDLHTGKLFSRNWGFWWSDSTGVAIVALSVTGVVLYVIPLWKKRSRKTKSAAVAAPKATAVRRTAAALPVAAMSATSEGGAS